MKKEKKHSSKTPYKGRELTFEDCIYALDKKRDIRIDLNEKTIYMLSNKDSKGNANSEKRNDIGNKSLGRLDYLVDRLGFTITYVEKFKKAEHKSFSN